MAFGVLFKALGDRGFAEFLKITTSNTFFYFHSLTMQQRSEEFTSMMEPVYSKYRPALDLVAFLNSKMSRFRSNKFDLFKQSVIVTALTLDELEDKV